MTGWSGDRRREEVPPPDDILRAGLAALGLAHEAPEGSGPSPGGMLVRYIREIELWNPRFGLVKAGREELVVRHVLDSLAGLSAVKDLLARCPGRLADIGSGAGLPGIPLAVYLSDVEVELVEPAAKRAAFLNATSALLGLGNVRVRQADMEALIAAGERYDLVTLRAFKPLDTRLLRKLASLITPGGAIAAYKGRSEALQSEIAALGDMGRYGLKHSVHALCVPFLNEERHLLVFNRGHGARP